MFYYCCIVYLVVHLYSKHCIELFFTSRRNTTFSSKVGKTGVGETGVGEQGISRSRIAHTKLESEYFTNQDE